MASYACLGNEVFRGDAATSKERKGQLRNIAGTLAWCPSAVQIGVCRSVSHRSPVVYNGELTKKSMFAGTPAGCRKDTRLSRGFSETYM